MAPQTPDIYFLHIPKTAGSSLASLIRNAYSEAEGLPVFEWQDIVRMSRVRINGYRCYTGHFGTGLYSLLDRDIATVTILRDPFERTVSHIGHTEREMQQAGAKASHEWGVDLYLFGQARSLHEKLRFAARGFNARYVNPILRDLQTRSLGVDVDLRPLLGKPDGRDYGHLLRGAQGGESMGAALARAKRRLDGMAVVGTVERFAETAELVCDLLGIPAPQALPQENVAGGHGAGSRYRESGQVPACLAARIDEITAYDRELYAYADRLLDQRLAQRRT